MKRLIRKILAVAVAVSCVMGGAVMTYAGEYDNVPSTASKLTLGVKRTCTLTPDDPEAWFSFTPSQTGYYSFRSFGEYDTAVQLYDSSFDQLDDADDFSCASMTDNNFDLREMLQANHKYYIKVRTYNTFLDEEASRSFSVAVIPCLSDGSVDVITGAGGRANLSAELPGCSGASYRWYDSELNPFSGASGSRYDLRNVSSGRRVYCKITYHGITIWQEYDISIDNGLQINNRDSLRFHLVHSGSSVTFNPSISCYDSSSMTYTWRKYVGESEVILANTRTYSPSDTTVSDLYDFNAYDRYGNEAGTSVYMFVMEEAYITDMHLDTDLAANFQTHPVTIFRYTPDRSGTYHIYSDAASSSDPLLAVFDGNLSFVAAHDDADGNNQKYNFDTNVVLTAGQTYYFVTCEYGIARGTDLSTSVRMTYLSDSTETSGTSTNRAASGYSVGDFIDRLYTVALGRASEPAGRADWIAAITERGASGAECARGFLYSNEFLGKNVTNEQFVRVLYRTFFNREADADGLAGWVSVLNNGASKEEIIEGFINSNEWANLCFLYGIRSGGTGTVTIEARPNDDTIDFCRRLYTTCLNRNGDEAGLMSWATALANHRTTGTEAARGFFFGAELTNQGLDNGEFITRLYRTFMGRNPDQAGYNAWLAQLDSGVSREEVFNGFAGSAEFARICESYGIDR